jgi:nitrogen regulatory protein PII
MDKKEIEELLQQFSQEEIKEALSKATKNKKRRRGRGKRKNNSKAQTKKQNSNNKFDDIMSTIRLSPDEVQELKEAAKADKMANQQQFKGRREQVKKVKITCSLCHKEFNMFPSQIFNKERWRCNSCISGR